jgi:hypothetical protein
MVESFRWQGFVYTQFWEEERKGSTWVMARVGVMEVRTLAPLYRGWGG